jgi:aminoglycoside phosphotransferase family enzyme/predicted kinase
MITGDQTEILEFLSSPGTHGGADVERIETHASVVFLAGTRALKLKRAVRYDYLDFSDAPRRRASCEAEVRINRRTAPDLYRGVLAVTREPDGSLRLGGSGVPVEWVIEMARFDQDDLFDRLAARGDLDLDLMRPLATAIADFHRGAEQRTDHGGRSGMAWVIDGNAEAFTEQGAGILDAALCSALTSESHRWLDRHGALLDGRRDAGSVRRCHGDLHLRNIVLWNGKPTLFDAVEFNDEIACIDVLYDLAFLLMDLWKRRLPRHANVIWNGYLAETMDLGGVALLPLFTSCRAAVRAKTSVAASALQSDPQKRGALQQLGREYVRMALDLLRPPAPCLIAIGGLSGSGKSSLAHALAPSIGAVPGAVVLRSDEIRKRLCGQPELARLGPEGYLPEVSRRVYGTVAERSAVVVQAGHAAIADAVFAQPEDRTAIEQVALGASVPFMGVWLDAPEGVLIDRVRERGPDASDADASVVRRQLVDDTGAVTWHRIDAAGDAGDVLSRVTALVQALLRGRSDRVTSGPDVPATGDGP